MPSLRGSGLSAQATGCVEQMPRPARWECESEGCRRLLGEIEGGRLRIARSVEVVYAVDHGIAVVCPGCEQPRTWRWVVTVAS
jgi:hypothetical protein